MTVLGRNPDEDGFNNWVSELSNKTKAGGDIAKGFFGSQEFKNQNFNNDEIIDTAYRAFFDREADDGGKTNWLNFLKQGHSIDEMLDGFIKSNEFINLAKKYGIKAYDEPAQTAPSTPTNNGSLYQGNWKGTSYLYLTGDPSTYCKWNYSIKVNPDGTGSTTSKLIAHNKDQGYCADSAYVTFKITSENSSGLTGKIMSSNVAIFGNIYSFSFVHQGNKLSSTIDINIEGYPARREATLIKQ